MSDTVDGPEPPEGIVFADDDLAMEVANRQISRWRSLLERLSSE